MSRKYFGTDGIRGRANAVITPDLAMKVGMAPLTEIDKQLAREYQNAMAEYERLPLLERECHRDHVDGVADAVARVGREPAHGANATGTASGSGCTAG